MLIAERTAQRCGNVPASLASAHPPIQLGHEVIVERNV